MISKKSFKEQKKETQRFLGGLKEDVDHKLDAVLEALKPLPEMNKRLTKVEETMYEEIKPKLDVTYETVKEMLPKLDATAEKVEAIAPIIEATFEKVGEIAIDVEGI